MESPRRPSSVASRFRPMACTERPRYFLRCASVEEAPPVPEPESEGEEACDLEVDFTPSAQPAHASGMVPQLIEVSGSCARAAYPAISPRSGMLKRKDGDQLGINGIYVLGNWHNSAPSWVRRGDKAWYIFRSADRRSWVIDSEAQNGPTCEAVSP
ncbi:unnamed protein product [Effrenium voratum]|nr:unnamed protein product [Effrenium voratum]